VPRVDRGWVLVDVSRILESPLEWVEPAVEWGAVLATAPARLSVRLGGRSVYVEAGVGSLVFPPGSGVEGLVVASPAWVDGCRVSGFEPPRVAEPGGGRVEPPLVALDVGDPVALFANGREWGGELGRAGGVRLVVDSRGATVLAYEGGYVLGVVSGRAREALEYMAGLYSPCRGR